MKKPEIVKILQWAYFFSFFSIILATIVMHIIPRPFLDILRIPTFIRLAEPYVGFTYISSLAVYHFTFAYFLLINLIDALSLFFYSNLFLKKLSLYSSYIGFILMGFVLLYFLYSFALIGFADKNAGASALVFLGLTITFFLLDLVTFIVDEEGIYGPAKPLLSKKA